MERRTPTDAQVEAAAVCVLEAYPECYRDLDRANRRVRECHAKLAAEHQEPYWAWSGGRRG